MLIRIGIDFDDTEFSIIERAPFANSSADNCFGAAVMTLGQCAGRIIAALLAGSCANIEEVLEDFNATVARSATRPNDYLPRADRLHHMPSES